jgi:hypothetical protein
VTDDLKKRKHEEKGEEQRDVDDEEVEKIGCEEGGGGKVKVKLYCH